MLIRNLDPFDPSITVDGLKEVMNVVLGPDHFESISIPHSVYGVSNVGHIEFSSQQDLDRALELLKGIKILNRPIAVLPLGTPEETKLYLGNIDPEEPTENIERLCREALGGEGVVEVDRISRRDYGTLLL